MSKAIDEMRAYFNQPPVPPAGALLEHRKKVNRWLDAAEAENDKLLEELEAEHVLAETFGHYHEDAKAENDKLRKVAKQMHDVIKDSCNVCDECYCSSWDEENECCVFDSYMRELRIM